MIAGDGVPRISRSASARSDAATTRAIPTGAPRGLYDAQHLFMPRFSAAYSLERDDGHPRRRRRVLRQAGRQHHLLAAEPAAVRADSGSTRTATSRIRRRRAAGAVGASATSTRSIPTCSCRADELQHQRAARAGGGYFVEVAYVGNRGAISSDSPAGHQPADVRRARAPTPRCRRRSASSTNACGRTGLLGDPHAPQRRRLELQLPAALRDQAPRRHHVHGVSYTLSRRSPTRAATATTTAGSRRQPRLHLRSGHPSIGVTPSSPR